MNTNKYQKGMYALLEGNKNINSYKEQKFLKNNQKKGLYKYRSPHQCPAKSLTSYFNRISTGLNAALHYSTLFTRSV